MRGKKTCGNEDLLGWWLMQRLFALLRVTGKMSEYLGKPSE